MRSYSFAQTFSEPSFWIVAISPVMTEPRLSSLTKGVLHDRFLSILAIHLHDNSILGAWKCKLLKTGFGVEFFR